MHHVLLERFDGFGMALGRAGSGARDANAVCLHRRAREQLGRGKHRLGRAARREHIGRQPKERRERGGGEQRGHDELAVKVDQCEKDGG